MRRVEGVDVLRGALACGVVFYHFLSWSQVSFYNDYSVVFEVLAVSFVEIFFVISGFSLFYVYRKRLNSISEVQSFFVRRFFRIAPLFYALLILVVVIKLGLFLLNVEVNRSLDLYSIFMNVTFFFGLVDPSNSLVISGWSVGVEMAMYLFFPLLLLWARTIYSTLLMLLGSLIIALWYSHEYLDVFLPLEEQWSSYVFFINHIVFFVTGFFCVFLFEKYEALTIKGGWFFLVLLSLVSLFALLLHFSSSTEEVLIGLGRLVLIFLCGFAVILFALCEIKNSFLLRLGELSYSIYLGHFFVFLVAEKLFNESAYIIIFAAIGTYFFAIFTHKYIEVPAIKYGKRK